MCEMPAVIVFNDHSIRLISSHDEFNSDNEWWLGMYESGDMLIDSCGNWYRLCYRDKKEEFEDRLKNCFMKRIANSEVDSKIVELCENSGHAMDPVVLSQFKKNQGIA